MLSATGFFTFRHDFKSSSQLTRTITFAYKPPGPILEGAIEDLILELSKGPSVPDAVVFLGVSEDPSCSLREELARGINQMAQLRLAGRVPLGHAALSLKTGKVRSGPLDAAARQQGFDAFAQVRDKTAEWLESGLRSIFEPELVILVAPPGYAYQKPSGDRERFFLRPELALATSASVSFVALALFFKLFAGRLERVRDLSSVYLDTMTIAPVAYGLRDLLNLCRGPRPYLIESFHSYGGMDKVKRPLPGTSVCLISASSSMSMQAKWIAEKEVGADEVVTLLTVNPVKQFPGGALLAIDCPVAVVSEGPPQLSIHLKGETFLPEQEPAKKVLLRETVHGCLPEVRLFREFAGNGVFDVWRRPVVGARRALFVDGAVLIQTEAFREWLLKELVHRVRAATEFIIHQDDPPSKLLAEMVSTVCELELGLAKLPTVAATALRELKLSENAGVVVCAAVIGKGSQLLEVSRALRDKHKGPRLYVVGFQVTEGRSEIKALPLNLKHAKDIQHEFTAFGTAAVGSQLAQSYRAEVSQYYPPSADLPQLPKRIALRASTLGEVDQVGVLALLPCGEATEGELQIRPGFAYWAQGYDTQACQPEILGTVGVLLQRAREDDKVPGEYRLASPSFRHVLLDPENFARFNDGVLQAALLRNAYPSEIDYRSDHSASDFMKSLILRALARATEESGEGLLEFLLALALGRLQLAEVHRDEIVEQATMSHQGPAGLKRAITFVLQPLIGKGGARAKMPF